MAKTSLTFYPQFECIETLFAWKDTASTDSHLEITIPWQPQNTFASLLAENIFQTFLFAAEQLRKESLETKKFVVEIIYV